MKKPFSPGREAYGVIFDNLLPIPANTLSTMVNLYAILYETVLSNDSFLFTNSRLQKILMTANGEVLLKNEIVVPLRRDTFDSFQSLAKNSMQKIAEYCANEDFVSFLEKNARPRVFSMKQVGDNYHAMSERILEPEVLASFGITRASVDVILQAISAGSKKAYHEAPNSFVYEQIKPLLPKTDGDKLMELVRAPYSLNLPSVLKTGIVGPEGFKGDQILAALRGKKKKTTSLGIAEANQKINSLYRKQIHDPLANWLLSKEVLESLSAEELLHIRSASSRDDYLDRLSSFLLMPTALNWELLAKKLLEYLHSAANELFNQRSRKNQIKKDPVGKPSEIEGCDALRIIGGQPVELRGLDAENKPDLSQLEIQPLQVIGNTFNIPDAKSFRKTANMAAQTRSDGTSDDGTKTAGKKDWKKPESYPVIYTTF